MDKGSVEIFGPYGFEKKLTELSKHIDYLSTGIVTSYALIYINRINFIFIFTYV